MIKSQMKQNNFEGFVSPISGCYNWGEFSAFDLRNWKQSRSILLFLVNQFSTTILNKYSWELFKIVVEKYSQLWQSVAIKRVTVRSPEVCPCYIFSCTIVWTDQIPLVVRLSFRFQVVTIFSFWTFKTNLYQNDRNFCQILSKTEVVSQFYSNW